MTILSLRRFFSAVIRVSLRSNVRLPNTKLHLNSAGHAIARHCRRNSATNVSIVVYRRVVNGCTGILTFRSHPSKSRHTRTKQPCILHARCGSIAVDGNGPVAAPCPCRRSGFEGCIGAGRHGERHQRRRHFRGGHNCSQCFHESNSQHGYERRRDIPRRGPPGRLL